MIHHKSCALLLAAGTVLGTLGCDGGKAATSFSALERCLLGKPPADDTELARRWRALELTLRKAPSETAATDWPKRCEPHANALYQSLDASAESKLLRKELAQQIGCTDQPQSCKFPAEGPVLRSPAALWKAFNMLGVERKPTPGVEAPVATGQAPLSGADWPTLAKQGWSLKDSHQTADGRVALLLRAPSGRVPVRLCELAGSADPALSFAEAKCRSPHESVPKMPLQSVMLVDYETTPVLSGLSAEGRKAFDFDTGKELSARGYPGSEVTEGLAVERGENDEGYEAYVLAGGKQGKGIAFDVDTPLAGPKTVGPFVAWVEKDDKGAVLLIQRSAGPNRLKESARLTGNWGGGDLRACRTKGGWVIASWGSARGERNAKPTHGSDGTELTVTFFDQAAGTWTKPVSGTLPFDRALESPMSCDDGSLRLAWARPSNDKPKAGLLACTADGCQSKESAWVSLGVERWVGVAPLAKGQLLVVHRTTLGDRRARIGDAAHFDKSKEVLLVDNEEHGGPAMGQPSVLVSDGATVVLFKGEKGLAGLRIGADGSAKPLPVK